MNTNESSKTIKTLATGLILGSLALASLTTVGCDKPLDAIAALAASTGDAGAFVQSDKFDDRGRLIVCCPRN